MHGAVAAARDSILQRRGAAFFGADFSVWMASAESACRIERLHLFEAASRAGGACGASSRYRRVAVRRCVSVPSRSAPPECAARGTTVSLPLRIAPPAAPLPPRYPRGARRSQPNASFRYWRGARCLRRLVSAPRRNAPSAASYRRRVPRSVLARSALPAALHLGTAAERAACGAASRDRRRARRLRRLCHRRVPRRRAPLGFCPPKFPGRVMIRDRALYRDEARRA
jgi:hypothetical protein